MRPISYIEIGKLVQQGEPVICVDVREGWQYRNTNAGGYSAPYNAIGQHLAHLMQYKDNGTIVLCAMKPHGRCEKTKLVASVLQKHGFSNLCELQNGIMQGWIQPLGSKVKMP